MEITEQRLMEAFGIEGGKEQELAEPVQEETDVITPEEEPAAEAEVNGSDDEPQEQTITETEQGSQTEEERRENAARRRQAEQQAAINAAVQAERERMQQAFEVEREEFFQQAGVTNPYTKEPITNMEEFRAWRKEHEARTLQKELESGKLTEETLSKLIDRNPTVQAMQEARQAQQIQEQQAQQAAFQQDVNRQMEEIRKMDPNVKEIKDLLEQPYSAEFREAVNRGNNFLDAFILTTRKQENARTAEAARQAAINNARSKGHLRPTSIGSKPGVTVSDEEMKFFHLFNPKATDEQIQKFVNKTRKE